VERHTYQNIKARRLEPLPAFLAEKNVPSAAARPPKDPLSLKAAVVLALANNPDVDMAVARVLQAGAAVREAEAAFFPRAGVYAELNHGDAPSAYLFKTIDQRALPPGANFNDPGSFDNTEAGLVLQWNLFSGGRDFLARHAALSGKAMSEWGRAEAENAVAAAVIDAYFNILAAQDFTAISKESVSTVERQLQITRARFEQGSALKSDMLSLEVRLAQAKEELLRAKNARALGAAALANILGLAPGAEISLSGEEELDLHLPKDYAAGVEMALAYRPELMRAREMVRQASMGVDMARAGFLPRVDAQAKYWMADESFDWETDRDNYAAGIVLNWDLFAGGRRAAAVRKAKASLEEMLAADRKTTQGVLLDLKSAFLRLGEALARVEVAGASVAQAQETLRLVKKQYEEGSATVTRYLEAELAHNQSRMRAANARYDKEKARAAVGRALGYCGRCGKEAMRSHE
jgi:outer membrane protein TolC